MATQTLPAVLIPDRAAAAKPTPRASPESSIKSSIKSSLLRRITDFIIETQTRRAEREIARHLRARGLPFTPGVAREPAR